MTDTPTQEEIEKLREQLQKSAAAGGYNLNPDEDFTRDLVEALLINTHRYGYQSCPCRLADGTREKDLDIICPCDYRDPDLAEFGSCYCALYVSREIARGEREVEQIPERRKKPHETEKRGPAFAEAMAGRNGKTGKESDTDTRTHPSTGSGQAGDAVKDLECPVWRCPVCGYLCAREHPPENCPICGADKDRFKKFL